MYIILIKVYFIIYTNKIYFLVAVLLELLDLLTLLGSGGFSGFKPNNSFLSSFDHGSRLLTISDIGKDAFLSM